LRWLCIFPAPYNIMKNTELKEKLFDEFTTWFKEKYFIWQDEQTKKMSSKLEEIIEAHIISCPSAERKMKEYDKAWHAAKIEFLKQSQHDYIDVILDKFNKKEIGKRALKVYCNEIKESLEGMENE
jgi:hypothetical protein